MFSKYLKCRWTRQSFRAFRLLATLAWLLSGLLIRAADTLTPPANTDLEENNGEDLTKPLDRFDIRMQAKTLPDDTDSHRILDDRNTETLTLRTDWVLSSKPDQVYLRFDLPYVWSNKTSSQNKSGAMESGLGDFLAQAAYVRTLNERWAVAGGMQTILPTATGDAFGNGKLQLAPTVAARRDFPEIASGSWALLVVREFVSVEGPPGRSNINYLQLQPQFNLNLPANWYLNTAPKINYYFESSKWFVPLDLMVGRKFGLHWVASVEYQYGLIRGSDQYQQWLEARLGYFF